MQIDSYYNKMSNTSIPKLIVTLSIPTVISMLVTNLYNLVDTAFVGTLGNSATGAIGIVFGYMSILQAVGFLFGQGAGSIISRKLGMHDYENASLYASNALILSLFISLLVEIISFVFLDKLITILGSTPTIIPYAKTYLFFIILTAPFVVTSFTLNNILRYEGKAFYGMVGLFTGALLNICGDAILIFGFNLGIFGAGLSTAISQIISFSILLLPFLQNKTQCKISYKKIKITKIGLWEIVATGFPSLLRQILNSFATILFNVQASFYGDSAVAAFSIVSRISFFIFAISIGIGQGFQPVSGFSYGAKKYNRLRTAYKFTFYLSECLMIVIGTVVFFNAQSLISIFRNDEQVIQIAFRALRLQCIAILFLPFGMVTEMLFQSTGKKLFATILSSCRNGLLFIPLLVVLPIFRGLKGIQEAQPISYILSFFLSIIFAYSFFKKLPKEA